ncbi:MAG: 3-dehydroquinate synthase [Chloroflexi bacterium]|nr:3-dehydroquinate synthase [Chloroflexota bacterium]
MTGRRNLILTGFMGTGKTSVARRLAERMGRTFIDMDDEIVTRAGHTIPEIFSQLGEDAFRHLESGLCADLSQRTDLVIATGGGCLVNPENRQVLSRSGLVICLDCAPEGIIARLKGSSDRPMLYGDSPEVRVRDLLSQRQRAYSEIPYHIDTTDRTIDQVVEAVHLLAEANPRLWLVRTPVSSYPVHLIPGGLGYAGDLLAAAHPLCEVALVSDEHVWPHWGARLQEALSDRGFRVSTIVLPPGEQNKTLQTVSHLYDRFFASGLGRSGFVVGLGGGVITDMAGFAAATYMRGVPFVAIPTSLLGMVDASVGGKVAVDLPQGKNLVGAFVQPLLVLLDPAVLNSLPENESRAGMAEIIKAGIIADPELFAMLEPAATRPDLSDLIARALQVKIDTVEEDPHERGRRAVLNLGHTFAHAYEVLEGYGLHHGLAVSIGTVRAALLAEARGISSPATTRRIADAFRAHGLPVDPPPHDPEEVYEAMQADKKKQGRQLRFVLPTQIGQVIVVDDVTEVEVIAALRRETP